MSTDKEANGDHVGATGPPKAPEGDEHDDGVTGLIPAAPVNVVCPLQTLKQNVSGFKRFREQIVVHKRGFEECNNGKRECVRRKGYNGTESREMDMYAISFVCNFRAGRKQHQILCCCIKNCIFRAGRIMQWY